MYPDCPHDEWVTSRQIQNLRKYRTMINKQNYPVCCKMINEATEKKKKNLELVLGLRECWWVA